jgi:hypothetical protein
MCGATSVTIARILFVRTVLLLPAIALGLLIVQGCTSVQPRVRRSPAGRVIVFPSPSVPEAPMARTVYDLTALIPVYGLAKGIRDYSIEKKIRESFLDEGFGVQKKLQSALVAALTDRRAGRVPSSRYRAGGERRGRSARAA